MTAAASSAYVPFSVSLSSSPASVSAAVVSASVSDSSNSVSFVFSVSVSATSVSPVPVVSFGTVVSSGADDSSVSSGALVSSALPEPVSQQEFPPAWK